MFYYLSHYIFFTKSNKGFHINSTFSVMNSIFRHNFLFYTSWHILHIVLWYLYKNILCFYLCSYITFACCFHRFLQAFLTHRQHYSILYFICWRHNRFYQARIDGRYLKSGIKDFSVLPHLYVLTITDKDPFDQDYMIYTVYNQCPEVLIKRFYILHHMGILLICIIFFIEIYFFLQLYFL